MEYLQNHRTLSSSDMDEVRSSIQSLSSPHDFDLKGDGAVLDARVSSAQCGDLTLVHMTYGEVEISLKSPEEDNDGLLLFLLTDGVGNVQHRSANLDCSVNWGFMRDLATPIQANQQSFSSFMLPLSKKKLKTHARSLIGNEVDFLDLDFDPRVNFSSPGEAAVRKTVHYIAEILDGPLRTLNSPIISAQMEDLLLTQLLTLLPNSYQGLVSDLSVATIVPYHVKRARDYIHAHASQKVGVSDVAVAAGCSYRAVQRGFLDAYGLSPMAYLRIVRLKSIRAVLLAGQDDRSISEISDKWGFPHTGRFSQAYKQEFGELPSETMRRNS